MNDQALPEQIAIIGMAGRFPGAVDVDGFWANLCAGIESIRAFTDEELAAAGVSAERRALPDFVNAGAVLDAADGFDAAFFDMSRREAELTDPQHRVFLETAWTALEHAGYDPARYPGRIGVFGGVAANTYHQRNILSHEDLVDRTGAYPMLIASEREYAITRVAYKLGLDGPALSVNTACSTSAVAVHLATQSLLSGESDMALAGGARIRVPLTGGYMYQEDGILSPDGHCRAFSDQARGTVAASGVAIIVLKRLTDALEDGDTVYALVRGSAINNDGSAKTGYTAPGVRGQVAVIEEALAVADVDPASVGMVEAHGTGTAIGDPIEMAALTEVFRNHTDERQFCAIGSLKTNIGHLDAAAGVAGIIKAALALHHERIPPSLHFERPNPQIDFESTPFFVNTELRPWPRTDQPRRAAVSSFGLGGTNAHVVLEEAPRAESRPSEERLTVLPLSARTESALAHGRGDLADHLERERPSLADVAHTLQGGRQSFERRRSVVAASVDEAIEALRAGSDRDPAAVVDDPTATFLLPGGGSQHAGMAARLYAGNPAYQEALTRCAAVLKRLDGPDLLEAIKRGEAGSTADAPLDRVSVALPVLFSVEYALAESWRAFGIEPVAMIGHSLGEYVAATLAGVFTLEDGLAIVSERARLMEAAPRGAMLSVGLAADEVTAYLDGEVSLAVVNTPDNAVVSGATEAVTALAARLEADGVDARTVPIAVGSHSVLMESVLEPYADYLRGVEMRPPRIPFISNVTGTWIEPEAATDPAYWVSHLRSTVRFADGLATMLEEDRVFIEVGPGQVLTSLVRRQPAFGKASIVIPSLPHPRQETDDERFFLGSVGAAWQAGLDVDWSPVAVAGAGRVGLPGYHFERERYWIDRKAAEGEASTEPVAVPVPSTADAPASSESRPALSRADYIAGRLVGILSDLSGEDELDRETTFLELGFDSLFLTQANSQFKRAFGLTLTFRLLLEEAPTVNALAAHLDASLPPDALRAELASAQAASQATGAAALSDAATLGMPSDVGELLDRTAQQVTAMERQLAQLRQALGVSEPSAATVPPPPSAPDLAESVPKVGGTVASMAQPSAPPAPAELTPTQQAALDALVERYTKRTQGSKAWADQARPRLADNRAVAGFDRLSKELTYLIVAERSEGGHIIDIDGNDYVDLTMSFGAALLGHSPAEVVAAVQDQLSVGYEVGIQNQLAGEVAELLCEMTGNERVTFAHSGSEAIEYAVRMARAVTGRDRVAYFSGDIHGRSDIVLGRTVVRGADTRTFPGTTGIPDHVAADALALEYGSGETLELIQAHAHELAAVLVEPVRTRNPDLQPAEFLRELRAICDASGVALVFDEVVTGFRVANGGAQEYFGIRADMVTYGKALGGGMPIGAVAGKRRFLDVIDGGAWRFGDESRPEVGMTVTGGTMIKHPIGLAASRAVLQRLQGAEGELQRELNERTARFARTLNEHFEAERIPIHIEHFSSFFLPTFTGDRRFEGLFFDFLRDAGVHIYRQYPCFLSTAHTEADVDALLDAFRSAAESMVRGDFFEAVEEVEAVPLTTTSPVPVRTLPLTDAQRDMWILTQLGPEASAAYHLSTVFELRGELDRGLLERALEVLVGHHESLRTAFADDGRYQRISGGAVLPLRTDDLSDLDASIRTRRLDDILEVEVDAPFDLTQGPLARARLVKTDHDRHVFVLSAHHLVSDGWSMGIFARDLATAYSALRRGETPSLSADAQFGEYVAWYNENAARSEEYWLELYPSAPRQLDLPIDRPRPPVRTFECAQERVRLAPELVSRLRALASDQEVTLFTVLLAGWQLALHRLSGQDDVPMGVFVAGQASMGRRDLTGMCVNFMPLRARYEPDATVAEYLTSLKWSTYEAFDQQHYTVGRLASALQAPRDPSRPMIVSSSITYETPTAGIEFDGLDVKVASNAKKHSAFDLEAYLTETDDGIEVVFQYASALFEPSTIGRWQHHYTNLLREMVGSPSEPVSRLALLTDAERRSLDADLSGPDVPIDEAVAYRSLERWAAEEPERIAIETTAGTVSYTELNARANRLARRLRALGAGPGRLVAIHLERSPDMLIALIAVHKSGAAYVPLDPQFPRERLRMIMADARPDALLTQSSLLGVLSDAETQTVVIDRDAAEIDAEDPSDLGLDVSPAQAAYVIYTSGSTGRPKGVEIPHLALTNLLLAMQERPGLLSEDRLLAVTTLSFDIAGLELWLPLISGARVVLADHEQAVDAMWLRDRLDAGDITVMQATPATWQMLVDAGWSGSPGLKALCGGEALGRELANALLDRVGELWNMYGPTETTIWSSVASVTRDDRPVPLGEPIANTQFHVLDDRMDPQPIGVPGELYIGGAGLAIGYRGREELTSERFVSFDIAGDAVRRLYRTGDVVRRLADGRVEFLGRADHQVKIRGYRIELGEIETVLGNHPAVRECVVVARGEIGTPQRLAAYVVPEREAVDNVSAIRASLRDTLPDYMVPSQFVLLEELPLTANRKVDRSRLPDPDHQRPDLASELVAPRTETESTLARIWQKELGLDEVGIHDSFFDLGGDSLLALRSIMEANRTGMNLTPISIFRHQTIAELAQEAETTAAPDEPGIATGVTLLTPAQLRFLIERETPDPHHWNLAALVETPSLSASALRSAVAALLAQHDSLRLRLWHDETGWRQEVAGLPEELPFESHDLAPLTPDERVAFIESTCAALQAAFDLDAGLLLRVAHFEGAPGEGDRLFVVVHHFAVDGLTWSVLWEDLEEAYRQAEQGRVVQLPPRTSSFKAWTSQLAHLAGSPRVTGAAEAWSELPWASVRRLPLDHPADAGANTNGSTAVETVVLDDEETDRLLGERVRPEQVIVAALARELSQWTGSPTVLMDILSHGRDATLDGINLARTVGFTLSYNPVLLTHATWALGPETLTDVLTQLARLPEGFTFELIRFLSEDEDLRRRFQALPRAELLFNYDGGSRPRREGEGAWHRAPESSGPSESPDGLRQYPLAVRATLTPNLRLDFVYSTNLHTAETIERRAQHVVGNIRALLPRAPSLT